MADGAIAVPSQASFGGPATQERSGPVSFASGMITHCQIMGQEPRIALTDPWLSLLLASADVVLPCTLAAPAPFDARVAGRTPPRETCPSPAREAAPQRHDWLLFAAADADRAAREPER